MGWHLVDGLFERKTRLRTLVGEAKLEVGALKAEEEHHSGEDGMMRIVHLISAQVSDLRLSFEGTGTTTDWGCPYATWTCKEGRIGVTLLQDEDSRIAQKMMIHISARANGKPYIADVEQLQRWLATTIYENRGKFGFEETFWL